MSEQTAATAQVPTAPAGDAQTTTAVPATATTETAAAATTADAGAAKPAEGTQPSKPAEGEAGKPAETKAGEKPAVPEKYADFAVPEGMTLDSKAVEAFAPVAKELGLNQEQAQKLVDLYAGQQRAQMEAWQSQVEAWGAEARNDTEIGGAKFDENVAMARKAVQQYATPALRATLDETGLGNHPEMIRLFARLGRTISEDSLAGVGSATGKRAAGPESLYPSMQM